MAAQSNAQQTFEELVAAVKQAESRGKRYAADGKTLTTSAKGALGEMQVMPGTITDPGFGVIPAKSSSPDEIARVGKDYLQAMTQKYGDTEKALIAYNWGPGSTDKWIAAGAKPEALPAETRTYVQRVKGLLGGNVSRETTAKKEPTPAEEVMTKALPAGTTAKASVPKLDMANMPASYKAAFALAALADAQDEEDDRVFNENKGTETEAFFASYKPVNHLASLDLGVEPIMMADGGEVTERKDEPFFDAASRTFVDVMTGRRTPITEKDFTAREQLAMMDAVKKSQARGGKGRVDYQDYPSGDQIGPDYVDIRNTLGGFQYKQGPDGSTVITDRYDFHGPRVAEYEKMGTGEKVLKSAKNALTEFVSKGFSPRDMAGELGRAWIGSKGPDVNIRIPVNRAEGSPEEGERLTPQQIERLAMESTTPAFIAQKSGIGRKSGNISKALNTGTAYPAIVEGIKDVPYDLAGLPVDLTTMAMRPFGYKNEKPTMGSEYLKEKATEAGIRNPTPTDPTLKGFHTLGEFGAGMVAPGKIIEGAQALKGKAADMLTKFQETRAAKPGMTDMMTGQRFEAPELTPEQVTAFENWRQNGQQLLRDQNAQQQQAAVARLPQDAQQQLRLFEEAGLQRPVERPLNNPPGWNIVETGTEAAAPAVTQARPATEVPVVAPVAAPAQVSVSAEFPFVGRLDEFAASMKGPAQKEQLINQVKGKFRDYDVARLEDALANLGPKDKVTPAMLQDALANTYSPSRFRSVDEPASAGRSLYNSMDNVFGPDKPMSGAMTLYLKQTPEIEAVAKDAAELRLGLNNIFRGNVDDTLFNRVDQLLTNSPVADKLTEASILKEKINSARPLYTKFSNIEKQAEEAADMIRFPSNHRENGTSFFNDVNNRVKSAVQEAEDAGQLPKFTIYERGMDYPAHVARQAEVGRIRREFTTNAENRIQRERALDIMQRGSDKLAALGVEPFDIPQLAEKLGIREGAVMDDWFLQFARTPELAEQLSNKVGAIKDSVKAGKQRIQSNLQNDYERAMGEISPHTGYRGQHEGLTSEIHPVGFSRYTEHTVDMNGKQLNGRHVHELQSDLAQDVRKTGPKGGSLEKDQAELQRIRDKTDELNDRLREGADPAAIEIEKNKLDKRRGDLLQRTARAGSNNYGLEQPFAGFETSPAVEMQLLIKNAIQSTMRAGQDFVTFPGKESAQAKLYEKVLPNLKQAVKDLGGEKAGFDIKPITLPNPNGDSPTVWGVVWSPETAARVMEKGVPFKKGGMVERKNDDNRRYL